MSKRISPRGSKTLKCACGRHSYSVTMDCDRVICWRCILEARNVNKLLYRDEINQNPETNEYNENEISPEPESVGMSEEPENVVGEDLKQEGVLEMEDKEQVVTAEKKVKKEKQANVPKGVNPVDPTTGKKKRGRPRKNPIIEGIK